MRVEKRDVYVADDGSVFENEEKCAAYEQKIAERDRALATLKVRRVSHSFDATEGKGYFGTTLILSDQSHAVVTQYCLDRFGPILCPWYGDGFYEAWHLRPPNETDTVDWALAHDGFKDRYAHKPWDLVVVSTTDFSWANLPGSVMPWPRPNSKK